MPELTITTRKRRVLRLPRNTHGRDLILAQPPGARNDPRLDLRIDGAIPTRELSAPDAPAPDEAEAPRM